MARRVLLGLGVCAAVALGVALRLHTRAQVAGGGSVRPFDSDSAYHLRRARFAAERFPRTILFDPLMNFPDGGVPIWPPLYDVALAAPARLAHGARATADQIERGAAWVPVALAGGTIVLAGLLARRLRRRSVAAAFAGAAFVAVCPAHILWTQYGHTDQHVAESFAGLLRSCSSLGAASGPMLPATPGARRAAGIALALAVLTWQGAIYWGAIFALALFVETVLRGGSVLRAAVWTLGLPAALTAAATAAWLGWLRPPLTYVSFGFFQPLFLAALCGGTAAFALAVRGPSWPRRRKAKSSRRSRSSRRRRRRRCPSPRRFSPGSPTESATSRARRTRRRDRAATSPIRRTGSRGSSRRGRSSPTAPVSPGGSSRRRSSSRRSSSSPGRARAVRGVRPGVHGALAIWGAVTLFLALSQRLNVYYAAPLSALALVEAARFASRAFAGRVPRYRSCRAGSSGPRSVSCWRCRWRRAFGRSWRVRRSRAPISSRRSTGCARSCPTRSTPTTRGSSARRPFPRASDAPPRCWRRGRSGT